METIEINETETLSPLWQSSRLPNILSYLYSTLQPADLDRANLHRKESYWLNQMSCYLSIIWESVRFPYDDVSQYTVCFLAGDSTDGINKILAAIFRSGTVMSYCGKRVCFMDADNHSDVILYRNFRFQVALPYCKCVLLCQMPIHRNMFLIAFLVGKANWFIMWIHSVDMGKYKPIILHYSQFHSLNGC